MEKVEALLAVVACACSFAGIFTMPNPVPWMMAACIWALTYLIGTVRREQGDE